MKNRFILILLLTLMGGLVNGQSPTPTPGTPFNPFQPPNRDYPTPTPTVSRKALSQVPSQTQGAKINRNSSTVASTPTPPPNNRMMPNRNAPGGGIMFGNGARAQPLPDRLMIIDSNGHQTSYKPTVNPPAGVDLKLTTQCFKLKRWLDSHSCNSWNWRWLCSYYFDHCAD